MFYGALRNACRSVHRSLHRDFSNKRYFSSTGAFRKFDGDGKTTASVLKNEADLRLRINGFSQGPEKEINVSTDSSFRDIMKGSAFVDKTLFIKTVFRNLKPKKMITTPRRFGKSINLDMLACFLELQVDENTGEPITKFNLGSKTFNGTPNYKLFTEAKTSEGLHLQIMADDEFVKTHFGKYPIIKVSFLCSDEVTSRTDAVNLCKESIHEAFQKHPYLYKNSDSKLEVYERDACEQWCTEEGKHGNPNYEQFKPNRVIRGLNDLSEYLRKFHERNVFVLIDEFDSIVARAIETVRDEDELKEIIRLVMDVIGTVVKGNEANLAGIFITGILDLHGAGLSPLLSNVEREAFGDDTPLLKYYGFNLEEVKKLFEIFSVDEVLRMKAINKYNGYYTKRGEHGIFNPYAIAMFLKNHREGDASLKRYWQESGYVQGLRNLFKKDTIKNLIQSMLKGISFPVEDTSSNELNLDNLITLYAANKSSLVDIEIALVIRFLLCQGYLSYLPKTESQQTAVGIPNDIRSVFHEKMVQHLKLHYGINSYVHENCKNELNNMMDVANKDKAEFIKALKSFTDKLRELIETTSIDPCNEAGIETVVLSVLLAAGYTCANQVCNIERNRRDMIAHKDGQGIIIELKYDKGSSRGALAQLFTQGYYNNFINEKHYDGSDIKLHLVMGLHFSEKVKGSKVKATVHCLRDVEINEVLKELNIEKVDSTGTEIVTEVRIAMACAEKEGANSFVEKAICVTSDLSHFANLIKYFSLH